MQEAFGTVVFVVCAVGIVGALVALLFNRRTWEEYGRDHLQLDSDHGRPAPRTAAGTPASVAERDLEIRQMLEARNARRRRRGEPEVEIEAEIARLTAPAIDDALRAEIRDMVLARNHRRARQGKPPLDVEAEIEREIADLAGV